MRTWHNQMLDNSYRTPAYQKKEFPVVPDGFYQVVLEDIQPVETQFKGVKEIKLRFQFVILTAGEFAGQKLWVKAAQTVYNNNGKSSWLFNLVKHLRGTEPSEAEQKEGVTAETLNALIGKQAVVMVNTNKGNNGMMYSNVKGMTPAQTLLPVPEHKTKEPMAVPVIEQDSVEQAEEPQTFAEEADPAKVEGSDLPF